MNVKLVAFGIARDILRSSEVQMDLEENASISSLKTLLSKRYPDFEKLKSLRLAINEDYQDDDYKLKENDEVVIIPPVSGG